MLIDETNSTIPLKMHGKSETLSVDIDRDSSVWPEPWVWLIREDDESGYTKLTLEEASLLHDRLGLILGRKAIHLGEVAEVQFDDGTTLAVVGEKASWNHA